MTSPVPVSVRRLALPEMCETRVMRRGGRHAYAVFTFQLAGQMKVEHAGVHELHAGDIHLIPAGAEHRLLSARDADVWGASLWPSALDFPRFASLLTPFEDVRRGALPRVTIAPERRELVACFFAELDALAGRDEPVRVESLLALLLAEIRDHRPSPVLLSGGPALTSQASDVTARALSFIGANALAPLSLSAVAEAIGRNRSYVADAVRRDTGRSIGDWILEVRLDEARRRLEQTNEMVEVIAERVGYADGTHFTRTFKRRFGVSPRAWRARRPPPT